MGAVLENKVAAAALNGDGERRLVERVAQSELFHKSPRLRELLLYVAECTLENRVADVREQVIAERVFGRKPDAGGQDSIVRAEARNLRKRLELYFEDGEGRNEPVVITMPKGGYALAFRNRSPEVRPPAPLYNIEPPPARMSRGYRALSVGLAMATLVASVLAFYWHAREVNLFRKVDAGPVTFPFSAMFNDGGDALIVTSDTGLLQISTLLHRRITLDEYIARTYPDVPDTNPSGLVRNWNIYEFTDGREMTIAGLILRHNAQFAPHISLRSGHAVQLQELKEHNAVLIGSPISNPWAQLYEDKLNFPCELESDGRIIFRNRVPAAHEADRFPNDEDNQHHRTYARIAFLPKTSDQGSAFLIAGTTAQSTQAAGEFVMDRDVLSRALRANGIDPFGPPRFFEILIRSSNFVGGAFSTEVVAIRRSTAPEH